MHLYIVVDCKTQKCKTVRVRMHLGEKGKTPASVEYWMSYPLTVDCPTCGKIYDYSDVEAKFWQKAFPAPPPGFRIGSPHPLSRPDRLSKKTEVSHLVHRHRIEVSRLRLAIAEGSRPPKWRVRSTL